MIPMAHLKQILHISPRLLSAVRDHARRDYPHEACGFLFGQLRDNAITVFNVMPVVNAAPVETRTRAYRIDPRDWMRAERQALQQGLMIIGIYHSHPDGLPVPSQTDIDALWPNLIYLITPAGSRETDACTAWTIDEDSGEVVRWAINVTE